MARAANEPNTASRFARLAGASRSILFFDGDDESHESFGPVPPLRPERTFRDCLLLLANNNIVTFRAGAPDSRSLGTFLWEANAAGFVLCRIEGPVPCTGLIFIEKDEAAEMVTFRAEAAAAHISELLVKQSADAAASLDLKLRQGFATLDAGGTLLFSDSLFEALLGIQMQQFAGRYFSSILDARARGRFRRWLEILPSKKSLSGVFVVSVESAGSRGGFPVLFTFDYSASLQNRGILCFVRLLSDDDAAQELVGRVASAIFPEPGITIRADRLLNEAVDALDLRLLAFVRAPSRGAPAVIELAAGPAVFHFDDITNMPEPAPWNDALLAGSSIEIPNLDESRVPFANYLLQRDIHSLAALSLKSALKSTSNEPFGVLLAFAGTPRALWTHERSALQTIGEFLATDLDRRRAENALERRAAELANALEATRELSTFREPEQLLKGIVRRASELVPAAETAVLYLEKDGSLVPAAQYSIKPVFPLPAGIAIQVDDKTAIGGAFLHREPRRLYPSNGKVNITIPPMTGPAESIQAFREKILEIQSAILVPLVVSDRCVGVLGVYELDSTKRIEEHEIEVLERFALSAAAALSQYQLFEALRLRSALVDAVHDAVLSVEENGTISFANGGAHKIFDRAKSLVSNFRLVDLFDPPEHSLVARGMESARAAGYWTGSVRAIRGGGDVFDASVSVSKREGDYGFVVIISDITERRALETRALQSQTLDNLGRLAAVIAHDFNNLLGSIVGFTSLMRTRLPAGAPALDEIGGIESVADDAAKLARRLLALGRTAPGTRAPINVNILIDEIHKFIRYTLQSDIIITLNLDPRPCMIEGDETELRQAFLNLAANARDAMPSGGRLSFTTKITPAQNGNDSRVVVIVSDTGSGMPPPVMKRLYEPFFTTKPPGQGTGLGSAIVLSTVRAHAGTIECRSEIGTGTTFEISFPESKNYTNKLLVNRAPVQLLRGSGTVLIVEDEPILRKVTADLVASLGYDAIAVPGGREALEVARARGSSAIDVVLLDLTMPGMSGVEVFEALRAIDPTVRVIITTGYAAAGAAESLLHRGALGLLSKPYRVAELSRALLNAKNRPRGEGESARTFI
ncbi:MAG: ATP-binding protein [Planctomycetota bacterium]